MKRMTYFVMALALVLGLSQCKKEQPLEPTNEGNGVRITLNVENDGNNGSRVNVTENHVTFQNGDQILVGYNGKYVGTITHNGTRFEGNIDATVSGTQPLYFYFVGNKNKNGASISVGDENYTVDISNQTAELPVLSFSESNETFTGGGPYTASLHNQCALVKLSLSNAISTVQLKNRYTTAIIDFETPGIARSGEADGTVTFYSKSGTEKWAILLPQDADATASVAIGGSNFAVNMPTILKNGYVTNIPQIDNSSVSSVIDLSTVTTTTHPNGFTAQDGDILNGELGDNAKISIADGATVTLRNVKINENGTWTNGNYAGITCEGNANIILENTNTVKGFYKEYPGVQAGPTGTTLTIQGSGTLNATGGSGGAAGIGSGKNASCGNITINGGTIIATGGTKVPSGNGTYQGGAGIGTGIGSQTISCGLITITDGTVTATGGYNAPGIGAGQAQSNANITNSCVGINISGGKVTAVGGENAAGIGSGYGIGLPANPTSSCGDINITGGTVDATGGSKGAGIGTGNTKTNGKSICGNITITTGVASVTATKGTNALNCIGKGNEGNYKICGTVTIGGTVYWDLKDGTTDEYEYKNGGDTYLTQDQIVYP